jgi:selenocysteine lyase/cysteine desulfurase
VAALDVDRARALTPGCEHILHLNHAGASLNPQPVLDAVIGHLRLEAEVGGYEAADRESARTRAVYESVARLLGASPGEIALTDSSTRGWQTAVHALPLGPGDRVVTVRAEYAANAITFLQLQRRTGCELVLVDDDEHGQLDLAAMEREVAHPSTRHVSVVHVPTQGGLVNPVAEVGSRCREAGVTFVVDACQAVGQLPVDVGSIGCDILAGAGRKFLRGPRGTGFLYVRRGLLEGLEPVAVDLHSAEWTAPDAYELRSDATRFELFEHSAALRLGLGAAVDHALEWGIDAIAARNAGLAEGLRARLAGIPGVTLHDQGERRCAITTFQVAGVPASSVAGALRTRGVNVSVSVAGWARFDLPHRGLDELVRASVHYITTEEELDRMAEDVAIIAAHR